MVRALLFNRESYFGFTLAVLPPRPFYLEQLNLGGATTKLGKNLMIFGSVLEKGEDLKEGLLLALFH